MVLFTIVFPILSNAYDFEVDGIYYYIRSTGDRTCAVTYGDAKYIENIDIPSSVSYRNNTLTVTGIGSDAFRNCTSLTSIEIPSSVTDIGFDAFKGCTALTSIEIPSSVTKIGDEAFRGCTALTSIDISNYVTSVGKYAFEGCTSLTSIRIPSSVSYIGIYAFSNCTSLSEIQLSEGLTSLNYGMFNNCTELQSLTIPGSISNIIFYNYDEKKPSDTFSESLKYLRFDYSDTELKASYFYTNRVHDTGWYDDRIKMFTNQIEKLYIDRTLKGPELISVESLKELILGEHIRTLQITGYNAPNLSTITCYATTPPKGVSFNKFQYTDMIVKVPNSALEAYKNAEGWRNFWNIEGFEYSGIDEVINDNTSKPNETGRYNLNGQAVSEDYKGVVIVRFSDGTTKKIMQ